MARACVFWSMVRRCRKMPGSYERIVLLFDGDDPEAVATARERWTAAGSRGLEATYWQPMKTAAGSAKA